jgi:alanine racemase
VKQGQEVTLFGKQKNAQISVAEMEDYSKLIFPELYTMWGQANPRYYLK